ncbi:MAG: response regulator transcription factor [Pseudomonadota bacterium]
MRVLVIEDDAETRLFLERGLSEQGWTVTCHSAPKEALLELGAKEFDVVILDWMLPGMAGIDVLKLLRGATLQVPVIMLTARSSIEDRVAGLEAGADDYLAKPFAIIELIARIKSIARRPQISAQETVLTAGTLSLDRARRIAKRGEDVLDLSPLEFRLLDVMMEHEGRVVTRSMLLELVWGYRFDPKTSLVQTHMSRLRTKLDKPYDTELIQTVRGSGYSLNANG